MLKIRYKIDSVSAYSLSAYYTNLRCFSINLAVRHRSVQRIRHGSVYEVNVVTTNEGAGTAGPLDSEWCAVAREGCYTSRYPMQPRRGLS